jgi:hypothetical protein
MNGRPARCCPIADTVDAQKPRPSPVEGHEQPVQREHRYNANVVRGSVPASPETRRAQPTPSERKELVLGHNYVSHHRRILRNMFMASAMSAVIAGASLRPVSAHAHGTAKGVAAHGHLVRASGAGVWRRDARQRHGLRDRLVTSARAVTRPATHASVEDEAKAGHAHEGGGIASVYSDRRRP